MPAMDAEAQPVRVMNAAVELVLQAEVRREWRMARLPFLEKHAAE